MRIIRRWWGTLLSVHNWGDQTSADTSTTLSLLRHHQPPRPLDNAKDFIRDQASTAPHHHYPIAGTVRMVPLFASLLTELNPPHCHDDADGDRDLQDAGAETKTMFSRQHCYYCCCTRLTIFVYTYMVYYDGVSLSRMYSVGTLDVLIFGHPSK